MSVQSATRPSLDIYLTRLGRSSISYILDLPGAYERVVEAFRLKSPRAVDMCLDAVDRTLLVGSRVARTNGGVNPCVAAYLAVGIIEAIESLQTPDCQPSIVEKCVALLRAYFADPVRFFDLAPISTD
jgi:hypothetical protein